MEYLTHDELRKVLATAANYGAREACMFALAYGHALRASEIASLTLADVMGGKIACRRGKKSEHTVELLRRHEIDALAAWLRERGDGDGLGSPITPPSPPQPATLAPVPCRTLAPRRGSGRSAAEFQYASREKSASARLLQPPRIVPPDFPATVSSTQRNTVGTDHAHGRTQSPSARYAPAPQPAFATSSMPSLCAWSCRNFAVRRNISQDGVRLTLTIIQER